MEAQLHHGISDDNLKKIGEVIVLWSTTEFLIANALNFLFHINDETLRREICSWSLSKKLDLLNKSSHDHPQRELVDEIFKHGRKWIVERNSVTHGGTMVDVDDHVFLEITKVWNQS